MQAGANPIFRQLRHQESFENDGLVLAPLLAQDEVDHLRDVYESTAGTERETYDFAANLGYYVSIFDGRRENREAADSAIRSALEAKLGELMPDYRILYCNFMVKAPGQGEIEVHQDFSFVDERRFTAFNLWIPLEDATVENGCVHFVRGSNSLFGTHRSASAPDTLTKYNESLKRFHEPVPMAAGEGAFFDHRLIHYSPPNQTDSPRVAAQLVLVPKQAETVTLHYDAEKGADGVDVYRIDRRDLVERNFWGPPTELELIDRWPYSPLPSEEDVIAALDELLESRRSAAPKTSGLARIFADQHLQESFERDGYVVFPLLDAETIAELRNLYLERTGGGNIENSPYGMFISLEMGNRDERRELMETIRSIVLPSLSKHLTDFKSHLGSFLVKVPGPESYTYPHQDWTFIDNDLQDRFFSMTVWISLDDIEKQHGSLGFVRGSHRFFRQPLGTPSPVIRTMTQTHEPLLFEYLEFPKIRAGDAVAFNNKTVHAALPNVTDQQRTAVAIGITPKDADIFHYYLRPGTDNRLLKLRVEEDEFFVRYETASLLALYQEGKIPEHCEIEEEIQFEIQPLTGDEMEQLLRAKGLQRHGSA